MKPSFKKILGLLALGLTTLSLNAQTAGQFGSLPLWFEATPAANFVAHGADSRFEVSATGTEFTLFKTNGESATGTLRLVGANPQARASGESPLAGKINYLCGNDPARWQVNVPTFSRVRVEEVYPGIGVLYYGSQQKLEYDFTLDAGVDPSVIRLEFSGSKKISVNPQGDLVIAYPDGELVQHPPVAYQIVGGQRKVVVASYEIRDSQTVTFALGAFDHHASLVIDPVLSYSTYFGGNLGEIAWAIAVNESDGSVYVAGQTFSTAFTNSIPFSTPGSYQTNNHGGKLAGDAFVARFDNSGTNLIYATYLGGTGDDSVYALAVNAAGNAFIAGGTVSTNYPVMNPIAGGNKIAGVLDPHVGYYPTDAFVTELNPSGSGLVYSTYIGGNSSETAYGIALDSTDDAFITGFTYSTNFPVTANAFQGSLQCSNTFYINANAFVAEVAAGGGSLNYSTYLGGTNYDEAHAIAFNNDRVFVAGFTYSTNFPNYNALLGYERINNGDDKKNYLPPDAFVTAFASSVTNLTLLYSTFLGGSNLDIATGIAARSDGSAYVSGFTTSTNFPFTTTNVTYLGEPYLITNKNYRLATNGTLTQIKWDGAHPKIGYSTMFGQKGVNVANGVALDPAGNAYVVGSATCTNFPVTTNNISGYLSATNSSQKNKGYSDAIVMEFNPDATALLYSAYLGGRDSDFGNAIAVDPLGNAYIAGQTISTNFPTLNARQTYRNGTNDMFIAKISQSETSSVSSLSIMADGAAPPGVNLSWQMFPPNYALEGATDLGSGNWLMVPGTPIYSNGWYHINLPATNDVEFFRLHQQ